MFWNRDSTRHFSQGMNWTFFEVLKLLCTIWCLLSGPSASTGPCTSAAQPYFSRTLEFQTIMDWSKQRCFHLWWTSWTGPISRCSSRGRRIHSKWKGCRVWGQNCSTQGETCSMFSASAMSVEGGRQRAAETPVWDAACTYACKSRHSCCNFTISKVPFTGPYMADEENFG